jgi:hypothetical protein
MKVQKHGKEVRVMVLEDFKKPDQNNKRRDYYELIGK